MLRELSVQGVPDFSCYVRAPTTKPTATVSSRKNIVKDETLMTGMCKKANSSPLNNCLTCQDVQLTLTQMCALPRLFRSDCITHLIPVGCMILPRTDHKFSPRVRAQYPGPQAVDHKKEPVCWSEVTSYRICLIW